MVDRRKEDRRKMQQLRNIERRLCERRQQIADEAARSGLHAIEEFRKRQRHTLDLNAIHLNGRVIA
jgi:hypothetical protein